MLVPVHCRHERSRCSRTSFRPLCHLSSSEETLQGENQDAKDHDRSESFISASSWGGAGWCVHTCACGSWWHGEGDGPISDMSVTAWASNGSRASYVALAADHLVAVELGGKSLERGLNDTTTEAENQVESGLLLSHLR
jgi:hypothetical protein